MSLRKYPAIIITLIFICIIFLCGFVIVDTFIIHHDNATATAYSTELIANSTSGDLGYVQVMRNVGNPDGKKIAYIVGVHPLENDTHRTLLKLLPKQTDLKNCYDIYIINVTEDFSSYGHLLPDDQPGRVTGQNLAYKYVYPQIMNGSYELAVDVHAHGGAYPLDTFVFCPVDGGLGETYAHNVSEHTKNISYYDPEHTTSGPFLTIPLNEHGIPAFYFEENSFFAQDIKDNHMLELIHAVDNLNFK